jgi:Fe2+ or Zn2+ uptake regulation protein
MKYLELKTSFLILETVALNDGLLTWYNIVKKVDQYECIERIPTVYEVLEELVNAGYLQVEASSNQNLAKYSITHHGIEFMKK